MPYDEINAGNHLFVLIIAPTGCSKSVNDVNGDMYFVNIATVTYCYFTFT